jgi:hypothetical protein
MIREPNPVTKAPGHWSWFDAAQISCAFVMFVFASSALVRGQSNLHFCVLVIQECQAQGTETLATVFAFNQAQLLQSGAHHWITVAKRTTTIQTLQGLSFRPT